MYDYMCKRRSIWGGRVIDGRVCMNVFCGFFFCGRYDGEKGCVMVARTRMKGARTRSLLCRTLGIVVWGDE
jgi:hypothetical protein